MNLISPAVIKNLLKKYNLKAKKSLGQHFLVDQNILSKIIEASQISKRDIVLEIGPGIGILTKELAQRAKRIIAVEIDRKMVEILKQTLRDFKNVKIIKKDALKVQKLRPKVQRYKIVSSIPYEITAPLLEKFLSFHPPPQLIVLLVQKEVAKKICAKPPEMNRLALFVQAYGRPRIISGVFKNSFWPKPRVDSAILLIRPYREPKEENKNALFNLIKDAFSQKRKQLKNTLEEEILDSAQIDSTKRPAELSLKEWKRIFKAYEQFN